MSWAQDGEPEIAAALTQDVVEIRSNFDGAELTLFGAATGLQDGDDIVVVVRGPETDLKVMKKRRVAGIWVNADPVRFEGVESLYAFGSTRPLREFATFSALRRNEIGTEHIHLPTPDIQRQETRFGVSGVTVSELGTEIIDYRSAIARNMARTGLYAQSPGEVERLEGGLFAARIQLPAATPTGQYRADVYLFRDGQPVATRSTELDVVKAGIERTIFNLAHNQPLLYGLLAVLMAILSGLAAAAINPRRN
jgi:uncharacterized protein (TIGR02186 family)